MHTLENDKIRLALNETGKLIELINKQTNANYAGGGYLWRLIYQDGISLEEELTGKGLVPDIVEQENMLFLRYDEETNPQLAFRMTITITLESDTFSFNLELENKDSNRVIRECQFPYLPQCQFKPDHELFTSTYGGQRFQNIHQEISRHSTQYIAQDNKEIQFANMYPGPTAMNFFLVASETEGLYIGSHDDTFQLTTHYTSKSGHDINLAIIKYPFLHPGEKALIKNGILAPYTGTWHVGARIYRKWADSWFVPPDIPASIQDMTSWQRIIMRHQYGKTFFHYKQLNSILEDGLSAGIKTLFLFGWHAGGHDSEYPDYSCDESQGGFAALKENIKKFQDGGGNVMLYFNGRLIDMASDFYRETGKNICIKRPDGSESNEFYKFGGDGTSLRLFGNKSFVTACPSSDEWVDRLKHFVDIAVDLNCDGVFFDQLGLAPAVCFDPSHGHRVPFTNIMAVNAENLKELRDYTKSKNPQMSFGTEWISDLTAQHVDYVHTIRQGTNLLNDWTKGEKPISDMFLELFYYTFPEIVLSDREIRDDTDIERRVNFALMKGLRSDVEIYRCRATIAETPCYRQYLRKANALRDKYRDIILNGLYRDSDHFRIDNPELSASAFESENKLAVLITQSHLKHAKTNLQVPGYRHIEHDGLNEFELSKTDEGIRVSLGQHGLIVIVFESCSA